MRRTRFARSGGLRIAYEMRGRWHRRRPWLVLLQGLGFDRAGWQPVLRLLGRRFRLVLVDNRGSGRSELARGSFSIRDMAADVVAVLDHAGVTRAHVLGLSLGGMVAQELAVDYPDRVDGLVLVSTTPGWPFAYPMPPASARLFAAARRLPHAEALRRHTENALSTTTLERHPELVGQLVELHQSRPGQPQGPAAQAAAGAVYSGGLRQRRIRARTLVLHGGADRVVDPRNGQLLASRIPGAQLVIFPDLGHLLCWQDPGGFAAAVTSFLLNGQPGAQPGSVARSQPGS